MARIEAPIQTPLHEIYAGIKAQRFFPDASAAYYAKGFSKKILKRNDCFFDWQSDRHKVQEILMPDLTKNKALSDFTKFSKKKVQVICTKLIDASDVEFFIRLDPSANKIETE